jgi:RES domain-containing protein
MIVYRLSKSKYSKDLSGAGAEKAGGRWNSKGTPMLYTSGSRALCVAEIAVHMPLGLVPQDYQLIIIEIPEKTAMLEIDPKDLQPGWYSFPPVKATQKTGDDFIRHGKYLVMKAPSAVVQGDFNYLINPRHRDFEQVRIMDIEIFQFDSRLFVK